MNSCWIFGKNVLEECREEIFEGPPGGFSETAIGEILERHHKGFLGRMLIVDRKFSELSPAGNLLIIPNGFLDEIMKKH